MKTDAISNLDRCHIIAHLAQHGRWKGERKGALVEMARFKAETGSRIYYSVTLEGHLIVTARAATVGAAVDDVNQIVAGHRPQLQTRAVSARCV